MSKSRIINQCKIELQKLRRLKKTMIENDKIEVKEVEFEHLFEEQFKVNKSLLLIKSKNIINLSVNVKKINNNSLLNQIYFVGVVPEECYPEMNIGALFSYNDVYGKIEIGKVTITSSGEIIIQAGSLLEINVETEFTFSIMYLIK